MTEDGRSVKDDRRPWTEDGILINGKIGKWLNSKKPVNPQLSAR
jgi:hypothetical protein